MHQLFHLWGHSHNVSTVNTSVKAREVVKSVDEDQTCLWTISRMLMAYMRHTEALTVE